MHSLYGFSRNGRNYLYKRSNTAGGENASRSQSGKRRPSGGDRLKKSSTKIDRGIKRFNRMIGDGCEN